MASRLFAARRALGAAALGAGAMWLGRATTAAEPTPAETNPPAAAAPPPPPPPTYSLYLPKESRDALAALGARLGVPRAAGEPSLAERVVGMAALTADDGAADGEVHVLALASDGERASALVCAPASEHGYGVALACVALGPLDESATARADAEARALAFWRALEASGQLLVERARDGAPTRARLRSGQPVWSGVVERGRVAMVHAPRRGAPAALARLPAVACTAESWDGGACVRECGFCKFMKGGPCRDAFVAWEACVDRCREGGTDFIQECGPATLALKHCTDEHPEYYGALMADAEADAAERKAADADGDGEAAEGAVAGAAAVEAPN
jgi:plasmid stabilization system protein ParE